MSRQRSNVEIHNITLTNANTEYSIELPLGFVALQAQSRTDADIRLAFQKGRVASASSGIYWTIKGECPSLHEWDCAPRPITLYFASASAGAVVEVVAWR